MPIPSLSNPKTLADQSRLKLFPLQSGPQFANVNISTGASGIVFTGYTRDASADNDAFSCCGSYTLRNSVHAAIAGMTSDNCTLFALKSVINQRPCLAVGGFDAEGKPVRLSQTEFEQVTRPLFNFADKVSRSSAANRHRAFRCAAVTPPTIIRSMRAAAVSASPIRTA